MFRSGYISTVSRCSCGPQLTWVWQPWVSRWFSHSHSRNVQSSKTLIYSLIWFLLLKRTSCCVDCTSGGATASGNGNVAADVEPLMKLTHGTKMRQNLCMLKKHLVTPPRVDRCSFLFSCQRSTSLLLLLLRWCLRLASANRACEGKTSKGNGKQLEHTHN